MSEREQAMRLGVLGVAALAAMALAGCSECPPGSNPDSVFCHREARDSGADAWVSDAGPADGGPDDAGPADLGPIDAGPDDAGPADAGPVDAGPVDAGPVDAGWTCTDRADCGGVDSCVAGVCVPCVPVSETCNNIDDNCNDLVDDGVPVGAACSTNPNPCRAGLTACVSGAPVCGDDPGSPTPVGTPCPGGVCSGAGACTACSAGAACATNPSACYNGTTQCGTGVAVCADDLGSPTAMGTPCVGGTCSGAGACTLTPVDCVGAWGSCSAACSGTQTFSISTPAANGGAACGAVNGATRACNTSTAYACPFGFGWSGLSLDCYSLNSSHGPGEMCCQSAAVTVPCVVGSALVTGCSAVAAPVTTCF